MANDRTEVLPRESRSCGKNTLREVLTAPSSVIERTEIVAESPRLPSASTGTRRMSYVPSGTTAPSLSRPSHGIENAPADTFVGKLRTSAPSAFRTPTSTLPASLMEALAANVSRTPSPLGENHGSGSLASGTSDRLAGVVSILTVPDLATGSGAFSQASWPAN